MYVQHDAVMVILRSCHFALFVLSSYCNPPAYLGVNVAILIPQLSCYHFFYIFFFWFLLVLLLVQYQYVRVPVVVVRVVILSPLVCRHGSVRLMV